MAQDAFDGVVACHQRRVFTFASYLLGSRAEAEDVTQEVLIRFWRHRARVETAHEGAWLLRVTRNACIDRVRAGRSRMRLVACGCDPAVMESVASEGPGPEARVWGGELCDLLARALARLPEPQRSAVILREVQGLSYQEIADVLEQPLTTVRVALHRGRRRLREELREDLDGLATA
jgi:RNA polymerase sigma-70 factor (ECF subfamily)